MKIQLERTDVLYLTGPNGKRYDVYPHKNNGDLVIDEVQE